MTFHTGAEDVFSLQHFKYRFCIIVLFREVMILKCKNFLKTLLFQGCTSVGFFSPELSSRSRIYQRTLNCLNFSLCRFSSREVLLPRSVPLSHFYFAPVSPIRLFFFFQLFVFLCVWLVFFVHFCIRYCNHIRPSHEWYPPETCLGRGTCWRCFFCGVELFAAGTDSYLQSYQSTPLQKAGNVDI